MQKLKHFDFEIQNHSKINHPMKEIQLRFFYRSVDYLAMNRCQNKSILENREAYILILIYDGCVFLLCNSGETPNVIVLVAVLQLKVPNVNF